MDSSDDGFTLSRTHSGEEYAGNALGISTALFVFVAVALVISLFVFAGLYYGVGLDPVPAGMVAIVPLILVIGYLAIRQSNPPGFITDSVENLLLHGDLGLERRQPLLDRLLSGTKPDGYFVNDLLVFAGPQAGGYAAKGYWLDVPDLRQASPEVCNTFHELIRRLLKLVPRDMRAMVQWSADGDYRPDLLRYQKQTANCTNPTARRVRNLTVAQMLEDMRDGRLRRARVAIFFGYPAAGRVSLPASHPDAEADFAQQLDQLAKEFDDQAKSWRTALANLGGGITPMKDKDYYLLYARKLNPSLAQRFGFDPLDFFDPQRSIIENTFHSGIRGQAPSGICVDHHYLETYVLQQLPNPTFPTQMYALTRLPFNTYDVTVHLERLPVEQVIAAQQRDLQRLDRQLARRNDPRLAMARTMKDERLRALARGDTVPFKFEMIVTVWAPTPELLARRALEVQRALNALNGASYYHVALATSTKHHFIKTWPAWLWSSHPGMKLLAFDDAVADFLLIPNSFVGDLPTAQALYRGTDGNVVGITTILGEGSAATGQHTTILGRTGTGKSWLLRDLLYQIAAFYEYYFIFDVGLSFADLTRSFGCEPTIFRVDGNQRLNLFETHGVLLTAAKLADITSALRAILGADDDDDKARQREAAIARDVARLCEEHALDKLRGWSEGQRFAIALHALALQRWRGEHDATAVEAFVQFRDWRQAHPDESEAYLTRLDEGAVREFESRNATAVRNLVFAYLKPEEQLTLTSLRQFLTVNAVGADKDLRQLLGKRLDSWCKGGTHGDLWDGPNNVSFTGRVAHAELGHLLESNKEDKGLAYLVIFSALQGHLATLPREARKLVLFDEAATLMEAKGGERLLRHAYTQSRKMGVTAMAVYHQYDALAASPTLCAALTGNSSQFFSFNPGADSGLEKLGAEIGLSNIAQKAIRSYASPDRLPAGQKYSEFCLFRPDSRLSISGTVRFVRNPEAEHVVPVPASNQKT